jgi:hypothetical protein
MELSPAEQSARDGDYAAQWICLLLLGAIALVVVIKILTPAPMPLLTSEQAMEAAEEVVPETPSRAIMLEGRTTPTGSAPLPSPPLPGTMP